MILRVGGKFLLVYLKRVSSRVGAVFSNSAKGYRFFSSFDPLTYCSLGYLGCLGPHLSHFFNSIACGVMQLGSMGERQKIKAQDALSDKNDQSKPKE